MSDREKVFENDYSKLIKEIETEEKFEPISLSNLLSMEFLESQWVIDNLIPYQGITIISGAPASYKTWLLLRMAIDIARGEKLLDQFNCSKYKVLIIDEESHLRLLQKRLKLLGANDTLPIYFLSQKGFLTSKQTLVDRVVEICKEKEIDIIFIDSLVRINSADENDASAMSQVFRDIKQFCQHGKTIIITHHEKKEQGFKNSASNRMRGSSDISAAVDAHISIVRDKDDKNKIVVEQAKLRNDKEIDPFEVRIESSDDQVQFTYTGVHQKNTPKKEDAKDAVLFLLEDEKNGIVKNEICKRINESEGIGKKSIGCAINELLKENRILIKKGIGNTQICYLPGSKETQNSSQETLI